MLIKLCSLLEEFLHDANGRNCSEDSIRYIENAVLLFDGKYSLTFDTPRFHFIYLLLAYSYIRQDSRTSQLACNLVSQFFREHTYYDFFFAAADGFTIFVDEDAVNGLLKLIEEVTYFDPSLFFTSVVCKDDTAKREMPMHFADDSYSFDVQWILEKVRREKREKLNFNNGDVLKITINKSCRSLIAVLKELEPASAESFIENVIQGNWFEPMTFKNVNLQEFYAVEAHKYAFFSTHLHNRKTDQTHLRYAISSFSYFKRISIARNESVRIALSDDNIHIFESTRDYSSIAYFADKHIGEINNFFSHTGNFDLSISFNYAHNFVQVLSLNSMMKKLIVELLTCKELEVQLDENTIRTVSPLVHAGIIKVSFDLTQTESK